MSKVLGRRVRCLGLLSGLAVAAPLCAADGDLDPSFGGTGIVVIGWGAEMHAAALDTAVQPDGRVVVVGYVIGDGNTDFAVARLLPDGSPDPDFGTSGLVRLPFDQIIDGMDISTELSLREDGRIWIGGLSFNGSGDNCAIARLLSTGDPDPSFSGNGQHVLGGGCQFVRALQERPTGELVIAVETGSGVGAVCQVDGTTGELDTSWANLGCRVLGGASRTMPGPRDLLLLDDGSVLIAGTVLIADPKGAPSANINAGLARVSSGGNLVSNFGVGGFGTCNWETATGQPSSSELTRAVEPSTDGTAFIIGGFQEDATGEFYAGACRFDTATGEWLAYGLEAVTPYFPLGDSGNAQGLNGAVALDGKLVVVGSRDGTWAYLSGTETGTARLTTSGGLDARYSTNGRRSYDFAPGIEGGYGVAVQHDGSLIVAGIGEDFEPTPDHDSLVMMVMRIEAGLPFRDNFESGSTISWSDVAP